MKNKVLLFTILGLLTSTIVGVGVAVGLTLGNVATAANPTVGAVYLTVLGVLLLVLIVEIVSVYKIDDSTFHTALLAGSLLALYTFSADMQLFLDNFEVYVPPFVFGITSEIVFVFVVTICCWYVMYLYDIKLDNTTVVSIIVPIIVALMTYSVTLIYGYSYIAHFVVVALFTVGFFKILITARRKSKIGLTTFFVASIFCISVGVQSVNALYYSGNTVAVTGLTLVYLALTVAMFLSVYLAFAIRSDIKAVKSTEYKHQAELYETKALANQIKPHFIFNSLEALRALYHKDVAEGDAAVNLLADFLRASVNSFDSELVPFDTEIDNVFNYTEFENLKRSDKIEVIFDIDYTDFCVPPFSIQPFVENAMKYSGVGEIENGKIIISSYKKGQNAVVEISDNGKGFDVAKIPDSSHGIRNACGRFSLALGTTPEIKSAAGVGTSIKIVIDLTKQKVKNENSRS